MLRVKSPKNLKSPKACSKQPTKSKTKDNDEDIGIAHTPTQLPTFVITNNEDFCMSLNFDDSLSESQEPASSTSPSKVFNKTKSNNFKVPLPVMGKEKSSPYKKSPRKLAPTEFTSVLDKNSAQAIVDELFNLDAAFSDADPLNTVTGETSARSAKDEYVLPDSRGVSSALPELGAAGQREPQTSGDEWREEVELLDSDSEKESSRKKRPYTKRAERKIRRKREDIPLAERVSRRAYLRRKHPRSPRHVSEELKAEDEPWSEEEKMTLLNGMKKHGHYDMDLLQCYVQTRSVGQVKKFVRYQMMLDKSRRCYRKSFKSEVLFRMERMNPYNRDVSVEFMRNDKNKQLYARRRKDSEWKRTVEAHDFDFWEHFLREIEDRVTPDYLDERQALIQFVHRHQALGHAFYLMKEFENHPPPADTGGVDIKTCYNFLWCCLARHTLPQLNIATRLFLSQQMENLNSTASQVEELVAYLDNLKKDMDKQQWSSRSRKRKASVKCKDEPSDDEEIKREEEDIDLQMRMLEDNEDDPSEDAQRDEGDSQWTKHWRRGKHRRKIQQGDEQLILKHPIAEDIPLPNPHLPSTQTPILKNMIFNPLSIPLSALKR